MINIERIVTVTEKKSTSWSELKEHAAAGKLDEVLHSGDTIDITLKNGEDVTLMVGKDHKGIVHFTCKDCLSETHVMNHSDTNKGGWANSEMRRYLNEEVFALLPDDLQAVIKPTKIVQVVDGERIEVEDKLFCFSITQVYGIDSSSSKEPEDSQIDIFEKLENGRKMCNGEQGCWWLRSADGSCKTEFYSVYDPDDTYYDSSDASYSLGVVFSFTI